MLLPCIIDQKQTVLFVLYQGYSTRNQDFHFSSYITIISLRIFCMIIFLLKTILVKTLIL